MAKRSEVSVLEVLQACRNYWATQINPVSDLPECKPPYYALQKKYPHKVALRKMEQLVGRGLIVYGCTITYAFLTPKGEELLKSLEGRAGQ